MMLKAFVLLASFAGVAANLIGDGKAPMDSWCTYNVVDAKCEAIPGDIVDSMELCEMACENAGVNYMSFKSSNNRCFCSDVCDPVVAGTAWAVYVQCAEAHCPLTNITMGEQIKCDGGTEVFDLTIEECEASAFMNVHPYYSYNPNNGGCITTPDCESYTEGTNGLWTVYGPCSYGGGADDPHFVTPHGETFDLKARDGDIVTIVEVPGSVIVDAELKGQNSDVVMDSLTVWANKQKVSLTLNNFEHDVKAMKRLLEGESKNVAVHPAVQNEGRDCWVQCGRTGPCAFCGQGNCCRKNWFGGLNGCSIEDGGVEHHLCTVPASTPEFNPFTTQERVQVSAIEALRDEFHEANRKAEIPSVTLTFEKFLVRIFHLQTHFDIEFDALEAGCHDSYSGLLGETFRCSGWRANEGKYKSMRSGGRRKIYKRAGSVTKDHM